jgi:anthranilate synthase component 1
MKELKYTTVAFSMLADTHTPVGIYLKLRDVFHQTLLLESSDYHAAENSFSYICCRPIAGIKALQDGVEINGYKSGKETIPFEQQSIFESFQSFSNSFSETNGKETIANGLFGYVSSDAVQHFDSFSFKKVNREIPAVWFTFYRFVIAFNHFKDELTIYENVPEGDESETNKIISLIRNKNIAGYPFQITGEEKTNVTDSTFISMIQKAIAHCFRGDVFQLVLSRRFMQPFTGDDMNVYRTLRSINPSPYLFYFDYGTFRIFGSSPEAQLVVSGNKAKINPIAGTFKRTGNDELDKALAEKLAKDEKENAEHVMLVDLARNDLSKHCSHVEVKQYKKIHFYSHVIHLVSEVEGTLDGKHNALQLLADSFPAGTLSGAPKHKAIELIHRYENMLRGFYGGCIGFIGFNGDINTAITIRSFLSKENTLHYQAGAGIVAASQPQSELEEVHNKLGALRKAMEQAKQMHV